MIGSKVLPKRSKIRRFLILYGVLGLGGLGLAGAFVAKGQQVPTAAGFMIVFGLGMAGMTWAKGSRPLVVVREEFLELNFHRRPEFIVYKKISTVTRTENGQLVVSVRDGHDIKKVTVWLRELELVDADRLAAFLQNKEWKQG